MACREADHSSAIHYPEVKAVTDFREAYPKMASSRGSEPNGGRHVVASNQALIGLSVLLLQVFDVSPAQRRKRTGATCGLTV